MEARSSKSRPALWVVLALVAIGAIYLATTKKAISPEIKSTDKQNAPVEVVKSMFQLLSSHSESFSAGRFLDGKNLTPEEEQFQSYFGESQRCAVLFRALSEREASLQSLRTSQISESSATVDVVAKAFESANDSEKTERMYKFDLRNRAGNWYIFELRSDALPMGVYSKFLELSGQSQ